MDELVARVVGDNREAAAFLVAWHRYCHLLDDIVDGDASPASAIQLGRWANDLYSSPFYRANQGALAPLVQLITCHYEDSTEMVKSENAWEVHEADVIRHAGADMVRVVAWLLGGYGHMRAVSRDIRSACYHEHHDADGVPR